MLSLNYVLPFLGGALASSLAIMTDAAHLLTDFASFLISLFAIFLAGRPATQMMSFGWHRAGAYEHLYYRVLEINLPETSLIIIYVSRS